MNGQHQKGFSLLEVMIAVVVIAVGVVGLLTLLNFTLNSASASVNRLIASNLAQEGAEIVRQSRDNASNWGAWYNSVQDDDYRARIQLASPFEWTLEQGPSSYQLRYNSASGLYHYDNNGDPLSIFSRKITINSISNVEKQVIVEVTWVDRGRSYSLTIENKLHNWK